MFKSHTHVQALPSTTWTVVHNLACKPISDVILADGEKILPMGIEHVDDNTIEITFSVALAGQVRVVGEVYNYYDLPLPAGTIDPGQP